MLQGIKKDNIEKISQQAQQGCADVYPEKTPQNSIVDSSVCSDSVSLVSNGKRDCFVTEKIVSDTNSNNFLRDCEALSKMQLRRRYNREANAHRNMLQRARTNGAFIHKSFHCFQEFLKYVGPIPAKGATLDRINNNDREYAPGKVRWADKRTQNNNKGDTLLISCITTDTTYTVSRLAKLQGVSSAAIRQRLARGWSDAEVLAGTRRRRVENTSSSNDAARVTFVDNAIANTSTKNEMTSRDKRYQEVQEMFERHREKFGEEALPAELDVLNELAASVNMSITREEYVQRFARDCWPSMRDHVNFFNASEFHQSVIEEIAPTFVAKMRKKKSFANGLEKKI